MEWLWRHTSVYKLVIYLTFLGMSMFINVNYVYATEPLCNLTIDAHSAFKNPLPGIFSGFKIGEYSSNALPDGFLSNKHQFKKSEHDKIINILPDENTYFLTTKNSKLYLVLRFDRAFEGFIKT